MNKKHISLKIRIIFMLFAAVMAITGVWINIMIVTLFGVILWIFSTILNVIYSGKDYRKNLYGFSGNSSIVQKNKDHVKV